MGIMNTAFIQTNMSRRKILLLIIAIIAGIVAIDIIFTSFRSVGVGRVGIVTQFGKVVAEDQSGLHPLLRGDVC